MNFGMREAIQPLANEIGLGMDKLNDRLDDLITQQARTNELLDNIYGALLIQLNKQNELIKQSETEASPTRAATAKARPKT